MEIQTEVMPAEISAKQKDKAQASEQQGKDVIEVKKKSRVSKIKNKVFCPYCNQETLLIWVHGHYQCGRCKYVVTGCCE